MNDQQPQQEQKINKVLNRKRFYNVVKIIIIVGSIFLLIYGFNIIVEGGFTSEEIKETCSMYEEGSARYNDCHKYLPPLRDDYRTAGYWIVFISIILPIAFFSGVLFYRRLPIVNEKK